MVPGFHRFQIFLRILIFPVLTPVCLHSFRIRIDIQISKVCIPFFQLVPAVLIRGKFIIDRAQGHFQSIIHSGQLSVQILRPIDQLEQVFRPHRSELLAQALAEVPAVCVHRAPVASQDLHPTGSPGRLVHAILQSLEIDLLVHVRVSEFHPQFSRSEECQELLQIIIVILSIRLLADDHAVFCIVIARVRGIILSPLQQVAQGIGNPCRIFAVRPAVPVIFHYVYRLLRVVRAVHLKKIFQPEHMEDLRHRIADRCLKVRGLFIRLVCHAQDLRRIRRPRECGPHSKRRHKYRAAQDPRDQNSCLDGSLSVPFSHKTPFFTFLPYIFSIL